MYCCRICGSEQVVSAMWVSLHNKEPITYRQHTTNLPTLTQEFCLDCDEPTTIIDKKFYDGLPKEDLE